MGETGMKLEEGCVHTPRSGFRRKQQAGPVDHGIEKRHLRTVVHVTTRCSQIYHDNINVYSATRRSSRMLGVRSLVHVRDVM